MAAGFYIFSSGAVALEDCDVPKMPQGLREEKLMRFRRIALGAVVILGFTFVPVELGSPAGATNPNLAKSSHGHTDKGKALPHVSGGSEVTFDEERAQAADAQSSSGSDLPPDATATALGCANRGTTTNPRVNQDCTARRQAEEQVAVNPLDPTNVIAGQNDSRIGFNHCGFDYSLNGGQTFGDGIPPFSQHLSPAGHTYDAASDPNVTFNGAGVAWYSCVVFDINTNASGIFAVPSTVGLKGSAYKNIAAGPSPFVVAETNDGHTFYDKQFMAGDPRPGNKSVYITFTKFVSDQKCSTGNNPGAYCSSEIFYSKWDATTQKWSPIANVSGDSSLCVGGNTLNKKASPSACNFNQGSMPVVMADGSVFVVWNNGNTPTALNQTLGRRIASNGTLGPVVQVGQDEESNVALCDFGRGPEECVKSLNVRTNDFPAIAVDPANATHLVAVWQDTRRSLPGAGKYDVVVSDSADGGTTWSDVNGGSPTVLEGATGEALFQPSVTITRTGTTAVSFYQANPYTGTEVGGGTFGYGMQTRPLVDATFGGYVPLSDGQAYPSPQANASQKGFLGDYSSIAADTTPGSNLVHAVWSDTRNSGAAGPDEDVFMATATP